MLDILGRRAVVVVFLGVLATMAGGSALAGASTSAAQTFRVRETVTSLAQVDVGPTGLSPGDEAIYRLRIDNPRGQRIGVNNVVCTVLTPVSAALAHCVGTAGLPTGTIEFGGVLSLRGVHSQFAVTGGTGDFHSALGQVLVRWTNAPTNTKAIVRVELTG